jgi:hypothetical protein
MSTEAEKATALELSIEAARDEYHAACDKATEAWLYYRKVFDANRSLLLSYDHPLYESVSATRFAALCAAKDADRKQDNAEYELSKLLRSRGPCNHPM